MKVDMKNIYQKLGLKNKTCYIFIAVILQIKTPNDKLGLWVFTDTVNNISIVVWQSMLQYLYKNRHVLKGGVEWSYGVKAWSRKVEWNFGVIPRPSFNHILEYNKWLKKKYGWKL